MKNEKLFEQFNKERNENKESITKLETQLQEDRKQFTQLNTDYKNHIASGDDDKADELYSEIAALEINIKKNEKKLATKKTVSKDVIKEKAMALIMNQPKLKRLYKDDKEKLLHEYKLKIDEVNAVVKKMNELNGKFEDEFTLFADYYEAYIEEDDDLKRAARGGGFTPNYYGKLVSPSIHVAANNIITFKGDL
ncbi:hypothetical protein AB4G91_06840 [Macrococcoides goetzii]|uniref:hypothetical protein n=1 Tax=Macrococcus sp. PK TaxID=2801919 RepID=UPI001F108F6F|nr:hypothetical protein [Macrococcus sp. PK]MCH4984917.1 hypothetical protein [Macrococcus sp. PK]